MTTLPGPDVLAAGLTSLTASSPFDDGGCLPCKKRSRGVAPAGYAVTDAAEPDVEDDADTGPVPLSEDANLVPWTGVLVVEGEMTGDGRLIAENALRVDSLPIPLRHVSSDVGGHDGATTVGTIEKMWRESTDDGLVLVMGSGYVDLSAPAGAEAARGILSGSQPGVSVDLDSVSFEVHVAAELVNAATSAKDAGDGEVEIPRTEDGSYIVSKVSADDEVMMTTDGRIRAATLVAIPAFASARLELLDPDAARQALTASGADGDALTQAFNWVQDEGGLPDYIQRIVKHLQEKGMAESHAIATAVNVVKKACATGDVNFPGVQHENAGSQSEACEAVDHWEAMKAKHAHAASADEFADNTDPESDTEDAPVTVKDATVPVAFDDTGTPCSMPDCDAPADGIVPLTDSDVPDDEGDGSVDGAPFCIDHLEVILAEVGDLPVAGQGDPDDDDEDYSAVVLDTATLTSLGYSAETIDRIATEFEIVHAPAGSPIGGQFISPSGGSGSQTQDAQDQADADTIEQLSKLSAKALQEVMANLQAASAGMTDGDAKTEMQHLMQDVTTAQANVAKTAKAAKGGKGKSGSSSKGKSDGSSKKGGSSSKGKSSGSGKSGSGAAAKAQKAKAAEEKKAKAAEVKAEKAKERQDAKDKRDADRATKAVERNAAKVAKAHAAEIKKTQTELSGYYKKFHSKITPEERGQVQSSIDTCTATLKKLTGPDAITAGGAPVAPDAPPAEWFRNPGLTEPTALRISPEGRVYGHLAAWNTCHTSHTAQGQCVLAPRTQTDYAYFHTGAVLTAEGTEERVGHITMDTRHAGGTLSPAQTMSHYEDTGTVIADVACGEDAHGIWFSGALRPWASEKQVRMLRSSPLSGDWRRAGNGLELVAALAVNVPGFPVPRPQGLVASGHVQSLIAGGMLAPSAITDTITASGNATEDDEEETELDNGPGSASPTVADHLTPEDVRYLKGLADRERDTLRAEADRLAAEMNADLARALAADMLTV